MNPGRHLASAALAALVVGGTHAAQVKSSAPGSAQRSLGGNANPNDPGEREFAVPYPRPGCGGVPSLAAKTMRWVNGVYLFSGEFHLEAVDMRVPGRGLDFVWARRYRSQAGPDTPQGHRWDYSYDLFLVASGGDLVLHDGFARKDTYGLQLDGTWTHRDHFRVISQELDGSYTLVFPDTGEWRFHALDGSPEAGRITAIQDHNGNNLSFTYDSSGRLVTITDTLARDYTVAYTPGGRIASVTDFTGRVVSYAYYQAGDAGGSDGDLMSATTPAVTGTPNGNDFASGKTTVYTYSKGFTDPRLDHNLLSITDPVGQVYLRNEYGTSRNPANFTFSRVVRQRWGNVDEIADLVYLVGVAPDGSLVRKTIVNDREGHVKECFYDLRDRGILLREYTGIANPDAPTTETKNRPGAPLRSSDPAFFETRWRYNQNSLPVRVDFPNGNSWHMLYDSANPDPRARGNLLRRTLLPGVLGGEQPVLQESFTYLPGFGGCCGTNFVETHTDFRGNVTTHGYDGSGNRLQTIHKIPTIVETWEYNAFGQVTAHVLPDNGSGHHRRDELTYYTMGPMRGYLQDRIVDATGLALTTTYETNARGAVIREIDPLGSDDLYVRNQLDQVVRHLSRAVTTPGGTVRYETDYFFDADDNLVQVDVQNIGGDGTLDANAYLTTTYEYDVLNYPTRRTREVDPGHDVVEEFVYDANRSRILTRYGEATNGNDPLNTLSLLYDERDLLYRSIRGLGGPDQSTTQYDYDGNMNVVAMIEGLEDDPRLTTHGIDGYDRRVQTTDPMGNVTEVHHDPNSNVTRMVVRGELVDLPGSAGNVRLSEVHTTYDVMDRRVQEDKEFFDSTTQTPIGDGQATMVWTYSDTSQLLTVSNDNGHVSSRNYDTANRVAMTTDSAGNTRQFSYDADSNLVQVVETDRSDVGGPDQVFTTTWSYDELERGVQNTDNVGNTRASIFDSRNNEVEVLDALGNRVTHSWDGLNRLVETVRFETDTGDGSGMVIGDVTTQRAWDDSSRLVSCTDDNGNTSSFTFDDLSREILRAHADGTVENFTYDVHSNVVSRTDARGTVVETVYDRLDRPTQNSVTTLGPGVAGDTLLETFAYDGEGRLVEAADEDALVVRRYDSLSGVVNETLNGETTSCSYDGVGNPTSCSYPGGRTVSRTFDVLERPSTISDGSGTIARYSYVGPRRREQIDLGNGTRVAYTYDGITGVSNAPGDFGVGRIVRTLHTRISPAMVIEDRTYRWDPVGDKLVRQAAGGFETTYEYDSIYRLTRTVVEDPSNMVVRDEEYDLDGVQNRLLVTGGTNPGAYTMDATLPEPADREMNQYTSTPSDQRRYDQAGNLTGIDIGMPVQREFSYDWKNQLVRVVDAGTGEEHRYGFDPFGRRIHRTVDAGGVSGGPLETRYFYAGQQVLEEQDAMGATTATYVYGPYVDEVLTMQRAGNDYYFHADDLYNVMALTDATGAVVERYDYGDYGAPLDAATLAPIPGNPSSVGNPYLFTCRRFDPETGWYHYRTRSMDPAVGRYTSRAPNGAWDDGANLGNGTSYGYNNPSSRMDVLQLSRIPGQSIGIPDASIRVPPEYLSGSSGRASVFPSEDIGDWLWERAKEAATCMFDNLKKYQDCVSQTGDVVCCYAWVTAANAACNWTAGQWTSEGWESYCETGGGGGVDESGDDCSWLNGEVVWVPCIAITTEGEQLTCECMVITENCEKTSDGECSCEARVVDSDCSTP